MGCPYCEQHDVPSPKPEITWAPKSRWDFDVKAEEERCLIRQFFKNNPDAGAAAISCPCRLCSVYC